MLLLCYYYFYSLLYFFFFFNDTATTEIYTLSLHDALPIYNIPAEQAIKNINATVEGFNALKLVIKIADKYQIEMPICEQVLSVIDRKSTRLNSSHALISYAVFCLKKKKKTKKTKQQQQTTNTIRHT